MIYIIVPQVPSVGQGDSDVSIEFVVGSTLSVSALFRQVVMCKRLSNTIATLAASHRL